MLILTKPPQQTRMKILHSPNFTKLSYLSVDDQPNFINRDRKGQGDTIFIDALPDSKTQVKERWKKDKKRSRKRRESVEKMPRGSI